MSKPRNELPALIAAALNAALAAISLLGDADYVLVTRFAIASLACFALVCFLERGNVLYLARTFILGLIGYFPIVVKILLGENVLFSGYEPSTQGFDIVALMYVATSFALLSNQAGLIWARRTPSAPRQDASASDSAQGRKAFGIVHITYWRVAGFCGIALALYSSYIFVTAYGEWVLTAAYASDDQGRGSLPFGSVGIFGAVGIFCLFVAGLKERMYMWKPVFLAVTLGFVAYSQLLMGLRQDAMSVTFGLVVIYGVVKHRDIALKLSYVPLVILAYAFLEIWGIARTALAAGMTVSSIVTVTFTSIHASDAVRMGTISPIATTFSNTVYLVESGMLNFSMGKSYLEWFLRIPPEALYPDRPQDYAWLFPKYGLITGGGFFELAEVYMNFGLIGCLVVPGIITFAMARAYLFAMNRQSMFSYFMLFAFLAIFLRGTWYQTFVFFRAFLVCILLYGAYVLAVQLFRARRSLGLAFSPRGASPSKVV